MKHCSIYGNTPNSKVFYASISSIKCDNCSIGSDQKGSFRTLNTAPTSFINYYKYLELNECKNGLDSWGDLKPVTPTNSQIQGQCNKCFTWHCKDEIRRPDDISFYRFLDYTFLLCCLH